MAFCDVLLVWRLRQTNVLLGMLPLFVLLFAPARCQYFEDGDVRLVGGSYQWEGRVEVYMSGVWGTITDSDWTDDDARVVCRKLGHFRAGATAHSGAYFGEGKGSVNLDSVWCTGSEYILTDCEIENSGSRISHSLDVGVKCQPVEGSYREGDIRLVGGSHNWEGRVEIFWKGGWGTISDSLWTANDARVVCRQLQHASGSGAAVACCQSYGEGIGAINIRNVACSGTERNIITCSYLNSTYLMGHQIDVGVQCQQGDEVTEGEIRLIGSKSWEGRVEIFLSGEWGTVCDNGAGTYDAQVVCRQLGYNIYNSYYRCCARSGPGTGPIHFANPACTGSEYRLHDCQNETAESCTHNEDWNVYCRIDGPEHLDIILSYGSYGYVQVFLSGSWLVVADSNTVWTIQSSNVVCRQLGYGLEGIEVTRTSYYYYSNSIQFMDNVVCNGAELKLSDCSHTIHVLSGRRSTTRTQCQYYDCRYGDIRLVGGESEREGRVEICNNRRWGTVCGSQWTNRHTAVVCRFLGFSDISIAYYSSEKYGKGTGLVLMDFVNCTGEEWRLYDGCTHYTHYYGCSHDDDVGVQCNPAQCSDGQLRLVEGSESSSGRVEICSGQRWNTFSSSQWSASNTRVACAELGFQEFSSSASYYGNGGGPRHSKYFQCTGSEHRLYQCTGNNNFRPRTYSSDVGVFCNEADCVDGQIRLMEGEGEWEGRLEICYNERWGTVGGDKWTQTNSDMVCKALGYGRSDGQANQSIPMAPSKPLYYHSIRCSSRDQSLLECGYSRHTDLTGTYPHAIVKCQKSVCEDGDLRLVGGASESEGRLEVCFDKRWGTIDGHGWTETDTQVACKQLGQSTEDISYKKLERMEHIITQSLPVFMTVVGCYGYEDKLTDCSYHEFESPTTSSIDISISCSRKENSTEDSRIEGTSDSANPAGGMVYASLSISVLLAVVVIALVVVIVVLKRRKKERSSNITFNSRNETVFLDDKLEGEDLQAESYKEMAVPNPLPLPPKSQLKGAPPKPSTKPQNMNSNRYARGGDSRPHTGGRPQPQPQPHSHFQSWGYQQQPQPPPEEGIYECPD